MTLGPSDRSAKFCSNCGTPCRCTSSLFATDIGCVLHRDPNGCASPTCRPAVSTTSAPGARPAPTAPNATDGFAAGSVAGLLVGAFLGREVLEKIALEVLKKALASPAATTAPTATTTPKTEKHHYSWCEVARCDGPVCTCLPGPDGIRAWRQDCDRWLRQLMTGAVVAQVFKTSSGWAWQVWDGSAAGAALMDASRRGHQPTLELARVAADNALAPLYASAAAPKRDGHGEGDVPTA
jgi:hypothetical protein